MKEDEELRLRLKFFFMNPIEKYLIRRRVPWKLLLQVLKIVFVTTQLIIFGKMRMGHVIFMDEADTTLRHIFLSDWSFDRDVRSYPPDNGPYSVYTVDDLYKQLSYAVKQYCTINSTSFGNYEYDYTNEKDDSEFPAQKLCIVQYRHGKRFLNNSSYFYDTRLVQNCTQVKLDKNDRENDNYSIFPYLASKNMTLDLSRFMKAILSFNLKTINLNKVMTSDLPDCFLITVQIVFDNSMHSGQVSISLTTEAQYLDCNGIILYAQPSEIVNALIVILDVVVLVVCVPSLLLCFRALIGAQVLKCEAKQYFFEHGMAFTRHDELLFLNFWYLLIFANDVSIILGTCFKFVLEYKVFDSGLLTATGMLLGVGTLFVWIGILRYLEFFSRYNILILTLNRSLPNVLRFTFCAGLLYFGFLFCGYVVLGPYNMKFRTLMSSSECLYSLINGDDMFATFSTTSDKSAAVLWFSRIYFYTFISLFIYVVLSLFISILMDSYESLKDRYHPEPSSVQDFVRACRDTPKTGRYPRDETAVFTHLMRLLRRKFPLKARNWIVVYSRPLRDSLS